MQENDRWSRSHEMSDSPLDIEQLQTHKHNIFTTLNSAASLEPFKSRFIPVNSIM